MDYLIDWCRGITKSGGENITLPAFAVLSIYTIFVKTTHNTFDQQEKETFCGEQKKFDFGCVILMVSLFLMINGFQFTFKFQVK